MESMPPATRACSFFRAAVSPLACRRRDESQRADLPARQGQSRGRSWTILKLQGRPLLLRQVGVRLGVSLKADLLACFAISASRHRAFSLLEVSTCNYVCDLQGLCLSSVTGKEAEGPSQAQVRRPAPKLDHTKIARDGCLRIRRRWISTTQLSRSRPPALLDRLVSDQH